ncbi:dethiobiotin synthase [Motiliproteus sp. MSK22-1]|uniref:dethiobiotin synthase n=1 Tax=Motiliproteus sp. MSK22-1 TaxID=1897630 RepID=UPI000977D1F7|nr:dethiobiotin synthase [Motiliproteus sp. MSK22-1]OMH38227.1 dethiobiotin synthase [Motiliproteus sp. MSK22-1]
MAKTFFITGTDTDAGKTIVTAAMLEAANSQGARTGAMKPVAAGAEDHGAGLQNDDALLLQQCSNASMSYEQINPVLLKEAIAPHIAAEREGRRLTAERLVGFCRGAMMQPLDLMLVEGAGGWRVPLNQHENLSELPRRLQLPTILVVGMRLGCLNHALLTAEAIVADRVPLIGWVANRVDPYMDCYQENLDTLKNRLRAPLLAELPFIEDVTAKEASAYMQEAVRTLLA